MIPYDFQLTNTIHNERIQDAENQRRFFKFGTTAHDSAQTQNILSKTLDAMSQKLKLSSAFRTSYVHSSSK